MRVVPSLLLVSLFAVACTRNVDDRKIYERCFVDQECDNETTSGCYRLIGETSTLGICSTFCSEPDTPCPSGGVCSDAYVMGDGGGGNTICIQSCTQDDQCPPGGFACRSGQCLPP